jgi:hypothetical protein
MTSSKSLPQRLGSSYVRSFIAHARARGLLKVSPVGLAGGGFTGPDSIDIGDLDHFPDTTCELKNTAESEDLSKGFNQVIAAQINRGTTWHMLFKKYRGRGPGLSYAIQTADQAITMIRLVTALRAMVGEDSYQTALTWASGSNAVGGEDGAGE